MSKKRKKESKKKDNIKNMKRAEKSPNKKIYQNFKKK